MTSYEFEQYLNIRSARSASFAPDGERLAFLLNTTGTMQVWTMDAPGSWPEQRTFFDERVTFVDWSPTRDELAFGMDEGGNERTQLYLLDLTDGAVTNLTDHPDAKHRWGGWSNDGDRFAFASNRHDRATFDVYVQRRDEVGRDAERVFEGDGWFSVWGWSPDDSALLVRKSRAGFDQELSVVDLDTGATDRLTASEDEVRYRSPRWSPSGDAVYVCTDEDADTLYLARLDRTTGDRRIVVEGGDWNVTGVSIHEETGTAAYTRNVDGYTDVEIGEVTGDGEWTPIAAPELPAGVAGGVEWSPEGDRFAITVSPSTNATNVHVVDAATGEVTRWTSAPTAGIPPETFVEPELIRYESFDGLEIPAFLTLPTNATEGDVPVVVDIHGGPASQRRPSFSAVRQYLVHRGYAMFEPNVRGSSGYGSEYAALDDVERRMDSVADIESGVRWLHDHPAIDPDRIAVMGGSYGGFMVLASMTEYPDLWAAGIDIVGIANWITFLENTGDWRRELREAEYGSLDDDREFLERISPLTSIEAIDAPLFVLHGENDPRVPVHEARQVAEEAKRQGVPVRTLIFEDEGHGFSKLRNRVEAYTAIGEFLDEHV